MPDLFTKPRRSAAEIDDRTAEKGWLAGMVVLNESYLWGRWPYWVAINLNGTIGPWPEWKIPPLPFLHHLPAADRTPGEEKLRKGQTARHDLHPTLIRNLESFGFNKPDILSGLGSVDQAARNVRECFEICLTRHGANLSGLVEWLLWGLGRGESRPRIPPESADVMYHDLELQRLIAHPADWGGFIGEAFIGKWHQQSRGWYGTPMAIANLMAGCIAPEEGTDRRLMSVMDPCVGTGRMLFEPSNWSLELYGMDIDHLITNLCIFNAYLFIPWLVTGDRSKIVEFRLRDMKRAFDELLREGEPPPAQPAATSPGAPAEPAPQLDFAFDAPLTAAASPPRPVKPTKHVIEPVIQSELFDLLASRAEALIRKKR